MNAFTLKYAKENLEKVIKEVIDRGDVVLIATDSGETLVMLPLEEWSSMKQTAHLMSNPANRKPLLESIQELHGSKQE